MQNGLRGAPSCRERNRGQQVTPDELPDVIAAEKAVDLNDLGTYLKQLLGRAQMKGKKGAQR